MPQLNKYQFSNLYQLIATESKIQAKVGLNIENDTGILDGDKFILPDSFLSVREKPNGYCTEDFKKECLKSRKLIYFYLKLTCIFLSIITMGLILFTFAFTILT